MRQPDLNWIVNFIWGIADDVLRDLRNRASQQALKADFEAYLDGFSPNVQEILENFEFRNQIPRLSKADAIGTLIEKLLSPDVMGGVRLASALYHWRRVPRILGAPVFSCGDETTL